MFKNLNSFPTHHGEILTNARDNDIWFVVTDDKPTTFEDYIFVQYSSFNVKSYKIDWGDGSEIYTAIAPTTTNITNHKYLKGTGRIDTNGREFWIMKVSYELYSIDYDHYIYPNGYGYVNYPQKIYNIAPYKYIVFGKILGNSNTVHLSCQHYHWKP